MRQHIAVLGIGYIGLPVTKRLCEAGHVVHAWNRTPAKAARLLPYGAQVHASAAEAIAEADMVISLLSSHEALDDVLFTQGAAQAFKPGSLMIDMTTAQPRQARAHAAQLNTRQVAHLDAPLSGGVAGAQGGTMAIMVGGKVADFQRALPLLESLGHATHVGPHGSGQLAKVANQMIVGITIGVVAEALLLCEKGGARMDRVLQAITGGFADSRVLQVHGQRMVDRDFAPRARMSVQLQDMRNALATADEVGFDAPISRLFESLYAEGTAHGLSDLDHAALFVELASRNGMR